MAFRKLDPEEREALRARQRDARRRRREALAADPRHVAAVAARKQALRETRRAAYAAAKARREPGETAQERRPKLPAPRPSKAAAKSNVIAFRRPR